MKGLIIFRCPFTDMNVQTPLEKRESNPAGALEAFTCPACTRIHLINTTTGKLAGGSRGG
jgi:hypothetical protein